MKAISGIGRQIVGSMVAATVASVLMAFIGLYIFYAVVIQFAPGLLPKDAWLPGGAEWLMILSLLGVGASVAFTLAIRLARRIVEPIVAVTLSARDIAGGNLKSRASPSSEPLGEGAMLVDNFNLLAEQLEQASDAVSRWNATIAHELRTPVTILSGRLQGLADGVFQPDPVLFRSLVKQVDGLARLIEDLRTVSLMHAGHLKTELARVALANEIEAIVALMHPSLSAGGFTVVLDLERGEADVDVSRTRQALLALLDNALRHSYPAGLTVRLQLTDQHVQIDVIDSGPGLPPDFIPYAFDPFRRHLESDRPVKGSGLGLSVVLAIAQAHEGTASYENIRGGACFSMRFKRYRPAASTAILSAPRA